MKKLMLLAFLMISTVALAHIDEKHGGGLTTKRFCTDASKTVCAHAHFHKYPSSLEESQFTLHIEFDDESIVVNEAFVDLWMDMGNDHGHGSAPLSIDPSEEVNHFEISNGWFVMQGEWLIRVKFKVDQKDMMIQIPVVIKK